MQNQGFDFLISLSLSCAARSNVEEKRKRELMYSLYSFAALYDEDIIVSPDNLLYKHGICFKKECGKTEDIPKDCALVEEDGKNFIRFDVGGETFRRFRQAGGTDFDEINKLDLYEMVDSLTSLDTATNELFTMWFIYFPFIPLMGAPLNREAYNSLKRKMLNEKVYANVLKSRYSDIIYDSVKEMVLSGVDPIITDWYIEYVQWKNEKTNKGISREAEKYQNFLAKGDFEYVLKGTEKLLNTFPWDEEILLMNIAARVSLGNKDKRLLTDAMILIDDAMKRGVNKKAYFSYYLGLCKLGTDDIEGAKQTFTQCAEKYDFELARFMLAAMKKYKGEKI